jgi:hypothetical protein
MRYHWGLGVGHLHAHQPTPSPSRIPDEPLSGNNDDRYVDPELGESPVNASPGTDSAGDIIVYESDNPELGLDDHELEGWQDVETDSDNDLDDSGGHDSLELEEGELEEGEEEEGEDFWGM